MFFSSSPWTYAYVPYTYHGVVNSRNQFAALERGPASARIVQFRLEIMYALAVRCLNNNQAGP
jgi:hypothetical protein